MYKTENFDFKRRLSIIVPCHNCEKTIGRLLGSILENKLDKDFYEVIICDDKSTDNTIEVAKSYSDIMNMWFCSTTRDIHCPGNTRQAALQYIGGEWFTFIDNDDMFEPDFFDNAFHYINTNPDTAKYTICTNIREFDAEQGIYIRSIIGEETDTWLHGKLFNTENTIHKFKCNFKEDLMSHEDVYFNSYNLAHLIEAGTDYIYLPIFGYKWVYRPDSLSRSYFSEKNFYIDTYLNDFLVGASYPFFDMYLRNTAINLKEFALNQIMMTLLHGYFYYQASIWRLGVDNTLTKSYEALKDLKRKIINELGLTSMDIINYIYNLPERYIKVKQGSFNGTCPFVETQSFRDFIANL